MLRPVYVALLAARGDCSQCRPPAAGAATHMPVGFFDDASFRWSPDALTNLRTRRCSRRHGDQHDRRVGRTIAPTRPARCGRRETTPRITSTTSTRSSHNANALRLQVLIDINGTPRWANGGQTPNHMPKKLTDLTTFAKMLATRYNGHHGHGNVDALVGVERAEPAALPDPAVLGQRRSSAPASTRSSTRRRTPASRPGTRSRRSRSARRRTSAATSRSPPPARASRSRPARSRACWPRRRG